MAGNNDFYSSDYNNEKLHTYSYLHGITPRPTRLWGPPSVLLNEYKGLLFPLE